MIYPDNRWKHAWDGIILFAVTFAAIEVPLRLVFGYTAEGWIFVADSLLAAIFLVDVVLQFYTVQSEQGRLIVDRSEVRRRYMKSWFVPDFLAALPFDLIFLLAGPLGLPALLAQRISRLVRMVRVLRLFHLAGILRTIQRQSTLHPGLLRMSILAYWILMAAHWVSCGWLAIVGSTGDRLLDYLNALYWCLTTIATVGYGDITPDRTNAVQLIYTMAVMVLGVGVYGYLIGNIATMIANLDVARAHHQEKMEQVTAFMRYRNIPPRLQSRIRNYYNYLWESRRGYDELSVITDLPDSLKADVVIHLNMEILEKVPIFRGSSNEFIRELVVELRPVVYTPGDYVFRRGELGERMYFVSKGRVEILTADDIEIKATLGEGDFFGEMALLFHQPRTASARAAEYCDLYYLDRSTFDRVLRRYPEFKKKVVAFAEERSSRPHDAVAEGHASDV